MTKLKKCVCGRNVNHWKDPGSKNGWLVLCQLCDLQVIYCKCKSLYNEEVIKED